MSGAIFFLMFFSLSCGMKYNFQLANGPSYIPSNNSHYFPYGDPKYDIKVKLLQVDPYSGLWMMLLRSQPGSILGTHRHYDQVYGYTLRGAWGYYEHPEWLAKEGDIVHETPGSVHTLYIGENHGETEVLFFVWGALEYLDENGQTKSIDDWRSMLDKYIRFSEENSLPIIDLTYPKSRVEDVHFHNHVKNEL